MSKGRVLLIEDEPDVAEAIAWQLDKAGLEVAVACTGEQGIEESRRGADLVLLDLNLPGMDGLEVCRLIRRQTATNRVPIIIVSARGEEVDRVLGLEMGADDYVVKPFSAKELVARCRAALRRSATADTPTEGYHDENFAIDYASCTVRYRDHVPGEFRAAWDKEADIANERSYIGMETAHGPVLIVQIAGLVARRIVTWPVVGEELAAGERFGLIKFSSRTDILVPRGTLDVRVKKGQAIKGALTPVGAWR